MIVVRVELWPGGLPDHPRRRELARMHICNVGGSADGRIGDYRCLTFRGRSAEALDRRDVQRRGAVTGYRRLDLHIWNLVARALAGMGYGGDAAGLDCGRRTPSPQASPHMGEGETGRAG